MIAIIDNDRLRRQSICEMLHYMGILSVGAESAACEKLPLHCSALLFASEGAIDTSDINDECDIPRYAVSGYYVPGVRACFSSGEPIAEVISAIKADMRHRGERCIGEYTLGALNASAELGGVSYLGKPVKLTRTEAMVLRYLILTYPQAASAEDILKYAFRAARLPEVSSVRTHVSIMNKKFKGAAGEALIVPSDPSGYVLSDAVVFANREPVLV